MSDVELTADESAYFENKGNIPEKKEAPEVVHPEPEPESDEPDIDFGPDDGDQPEPDAKADDGKKQVKTVPHQALHQERVKRQELERQLQAEREKQARIEERLNILNGLIQPQDKPQTPDPIQDPIGALQHTQAQLADMQRQSQEAERQRLEAERQQAAIRQIDTAYASTWQEFMGEHEDAPGAYNHFVTVLDHHFRMRGVVDPAQRQQLIAGEERAIALAAHQTGQNAAELIYNQAKMYGWQPQPVAQPAQASQEAAKVNETIQRKQEGQRAARSMSNVGGGAGDRLTPEALASMSEEEFASYYEKLSPSKQARLLGAR